MALLNAIGCSHLEGRDVSGGGNVIPIDRWIGPACTDSDTSRIRASPSSVTARRNQAMTDLEARFEQEMIEKVYRAAGRETGYWAGYFLRSVKQHGGIGTARRLLERPHVSKGLLKLAELNRLDLA